MVGWSGNKLKLGVDNKDDYANLVATDKWATKINEIDVEGIKLKFTPNSFALVVRYVSSDLDQDFVANEIRRTVASADCIRRIEYSYQRKSNDYRFDVKDYQEYNSILKLGRIGIGHSWLAITPFYPGNRLTFCTKCWCIEHLRNECNVMARCRVCLENFNHQHLCNNKPKCAQCGESHHSLDSQCPIIRQHKQQLKERVDEAISSGKILRVESKKQVEDFEYREDGFPITKKVDSNLLNKWNIEQNRTTWPANTANSLDTEKSLVNINNTLSELLDSNNRVKAKVDQLKTTTLDVQLHQAALLDIITTMKDFLQNFIPQLLTTGKLERITLMPRAQQYFNRFHAASIRLNDGFQLNRIISCTPTVN